jgi:hypothetical protein
VPGSSSHRQCTTSRVHPSELCQALQRPSPAPGAIPRDPGPNIALSYVGSDACTAFALPPAARPSTRPARRTDPRVRARRVRGKASFRTVRAEAVGAEVSDPCRLPGTFHEPAVTAKMGHDPVVPLPSIHAEFPATSSQKGSRNRFGSRGRHAPHFTLTGATLRRLSLPVTESTT